MYRKLIENLPLLEDTFLPQTEDMSIRMVACAMVQDYAGRPLRPDLFASLASMDGDTPIFERLGASFGLPGLTAIDYYSGPVRQSDTAMYTTLEFAVLDAEGHLRDETHESLGFVDSHGRVIVLYDPVPGLRIYKCLGCRHWQLIQKEAA
jgi:hypothetical protein